MEAERSAKKRRRNPITAIINPENLPSRENLITELRLTKSNSIPIISFNNIAKRMSIEPKPFCPLFVHKIEQHRFAGSAKPLELHRPGNKTVQIQPNALRATNKPRKTENGENGTAELRPADEHAGDPTGHLAEGASAGEGGRQGHPRNRIEEM